MKTIKNSSGTNTSTDSAVPRFIFSLDKWTHTNFIEVNPKNLSCDYLAPSINTVQELNCPIKSQHEHRKRRRSGGRGKDA